MCTNHIFSCCFTIETADFFSSRPSANQSSQPRRPTNPYLSSKSSRSGHEEKVQKEDPSVLSMQTETNPATHVATALLRVSEPSLLDCKNTSTNMLEPQTLFEGNRVSGTGCVSVYALYKVYIGFNVDAARVMIQLMCILRFYML